MVIKRKKYLRVNDQFSWIDFSPSNVHALVGRKMGKVTTVFMDSKESTDLYPPTLKGALFFLLVTALTAFVFIKLHQNTNQEPTQRVPIDGYANVQGLVKKAFNGHYAAFLGLPFAKPPIGELRFSKPVPMDRVANWANRTVFATKHAPSCHTMLKLNRKNNQSKSSSGDPQSEDCLYLNVYVPLNKEHELPSKPLPVMVWIHGGAFVWGSAIQYDPSELVTYQSVIVVTIQYRLSILGFAQTTDPKQIPGNMGLYDQTMALKWVHEHIRRFGGDRNSITIFGESAGAISVGYHLISKQSVGLFNRAILQSGAPLTMMQVGSESGPLWMEKVAIELRCPIKSRKLSKAKYASFSEDTYRCLRAAPVEKLLKVELDLIAGKKCSGFSPSVDHDTGFFGNHPLELMKGEGDPFVPNVTEILLGHNGAEGTMFLHFVLPELFPKTADLPGNLSYELIRQKIMEKAPDKRNQIDLIYKALVDDVDPKQRKNISQIAARFNRYIGDAAFYCPNLHFMDKFLTNESRKAYYYLFNARPEKAAKSSFTWTKKAIHAEEIQFVFGRPFAKKEWTKFTPKERTLSMVIMEDWANFARSGVPRKDQWKSCQGEDERSHMSYEIDWTGVKSGLPENQCSEYFENTYEEIVSRYKYMGHL